MRARGPALPGAVLARQMVRARCIGNDGIGLKLTGGNIVTQAADAGFQGDRPRRSPVFERDPCVVLCVHGVMLECYSNRYPTDLEYARIVSCVSARSSIDVDSVSTYDDPRHFLIAMLHIALHLGGDA